MRIPVSLALLIGTLQSIAQIQFGSTQMIEACENEEPVVVFVSDLDGDGDPDVVSGSRQDDRLVWYANDGAGNFGAVRIVSTGVTDLEWAHADDMDADGDMDLLAFSWGNHSLYLFANTGAGEFLGPDTLVTDAYGLARITTADVDGDGDPDVLTCTDAEELSWLPNLGDGTFGPENVIDPDNYNSAYHLACKDIDSDGDVDIVFASQPDPACLLNNGDGTFAPQVPLPGNNTDCRNMELADLDGDGILDAVASSYYLSQHSHWFRGLGDGTFAEVIHLYGPGNTYSIPVDVDGDGDQDIISGRDANGTIHWYPNDGTATFDAPVEITRTAYALACLYAADLDADGDADLLCASRSDDKISWHRNDGGVYSPQIMISEAASDVIMAIGADLDGDGDNDVAAISFSDRKLAWYPNDGAGHIGPIQRVTLTASYPQAMCYGDMDGDTDVDIVVGTHGDSSLTLYKNNGSGVFDQTAMIDDDLFEPSGLNAADLDGDGDLDLVATSWDVGVFWYRNEGGDVFTEDHLATIQGAGDVIAADMDNDGDADLVYDKGYSVQWRANDGSGDFGIEQQVYAPGVGDRLCAADMDGDGDQDVLIVTSSGVVICVNDALTFSPVVVEEDLYSPSCPEATDLDADGDMDILVAGAYGDYILFYENLGAGVFGSSQLVSNEMDFPRYVTGTDLDNDGTRDVLCASGSGNEIIWWHTQEPAIALSATAIHASTFALSVAPNPMTTVTRLRADRDLTAKDRVEVLDVHGRVVCIHHGVGTPELLIERKGLSAGAYTARDSS